MNKKNIIILIIILLVHFILINGMEKTIFYLYIPNNELVLRPNNDCKSNLINKISCIGLPSGHAEFITILSFILYNYKIISLPIALLLIIIISVQRIIAVRHTLKQVLIGILFGCIYGWIYKQTDLSIKSILFILILTIVLCVIILFKLNKNINEQIPSWVDSSMYKSIDKKRNTSEYIKISEVLYNSLAFNQNVINIKWYDLELLLDNIISKIKQTNIKYNCVVGIKTGGAIISDYISKKLNIKNYKIKISDKKFNCGKKNKNSVIDCLDKYILKKVKHYDICEGINDDITNKNIILIDELVASGDTMITAYNYLKNIKNVNNIYTTVITLRSDYYKYDLDIDYLIKGQIHVYPWGFDN